MDITNPTLLIYTLAAIIIALVVWIVLLEWRLTKIFQGKHARDLEDILADMGQFIEELSQKHDDLENFSQIMDARLRKSIQKVHTVRFNPFRDQGGNQSFATSLLDEDGNGVVISSLYSRDKVGIYAKPITAGKSDFELSEEELESINSARASQKS
ncbi:MAG: DUF4446 family protein [Candidatus Paceibacterota bacterium]|jgi:hypothetical protein